MAPEREDSELIAAVRSGDRSAFGELVGRYQQVAFRAAYLITRDAGAAEEAAQDGFIRAFRSIGNFHADEPFRPWLLRIVTNLALNQVRSRSRRRGLLDRIGFQRLPAAEPAPELEVLGSERQRQLWAAVRELPEEDRVVLYLRYFLELPEKEIAVVIGKAQGTVKSRLSRSGVRLRTVIESSYPGLLPGQGESHD
ncbi:MAG: sigma-70 family RNA polymerase sigma factor [bacterium]